MMTGKNSILFLEFNKQFFGGGKLVQLNQKIT